MKNQGTSNIEGSDEGLETTILAQSVWFPWPLSLISSMTVGKVAFKKSKDPATVNQRIGGSIPGSTSWAKHFTPSCSCMVCE